MSDTYARDMKQDKYLNKKDFNMNLIEVKINEDALKELIKTSVYEVVGELNNLKKDFKNQLDSLSKEIKSEIENLKKEKKDIGKKVEELKENINYIRKELKSCEEIKGELKEIKTDVNDIKKFIKEELGEIKKLKGDIKRDIKEEINTFKDGIIQEFNNRNEEMIENIKRIISEFFGFNKNVRELEDKLKQKEMENENLKTELENEINQKESLQKEKNELKNKIEKIEKELLNLEEKLNFLKDELKEKDSELERLREIEKVFYNDDIKRILDAILKNEALEKFKEDMNIKDYSPISLFNLLKLIGDKRIFVNSFYNYIVEYKKTHQDRMSENEKDFYKEVNKFFNEEIFDVIDIVKEDEFVKSKHRGINGETKGKLSEDKIVLIPACKVEERKMRVKLES